VILQSHIRRIDVAGGSRYVTLQSHIGASCCATLQSKTECRRWISLCDPTVTLSHNSHNCDTTVTVSHNKIHLCTGSHSVRIHIHFTCIAMSFVFASLYMYIHIRKLDKIHSDMTRANSESAEFVGWFLGKTVQLVSHEEWGGKRRVKESYTYEKRGPPRQ